MLRFTLANIRARKRRLLSTSLGVLLGVAFLCGTLVLGDTIRRSFDDLLATVNSGTDAYVRSTSSIAAGTGPGGGGNRVRARLDESLADQVRTVPGVAAVAVSVTANRVTILDRSGQELGSGGRGAPSIGGNWIDDAELNPFRLATGQAPRAPDDVVIDRDTANKAGYHVGDTVMIEVPDARPFHITGIATFGTQDSAGGATTALFTLPTAQSLLGAPGKVDAVLARAQPGISQQTLVDRITATLPPGVEAITGAAITKEQQDSFQQRISGFTTFFSAFGYVAVIVGGFVIYNTFSTLVAQRSREVALLRAVGASRRQVLASVLAEAAAVAIVASAVGVVGGLGVATLLRRVFGAAGFAFPAGGLVLRPSTIVIGFVVGTFVTAVAALGPAVRASRTLPLAALREASVDTSNTSHGRLVAGVIVTALGVGVVALGVSSGNVAPIGLGAFFTLVGAIVLGPVVARPITGALGAPARALKGISGSLARDNAMRNPRRTSGTAAALLIGVAVVTLFTVIAASLKATTADQIDKTFIGDFVVASSNFRGGGFSPQLAHQLVGVPQVAAAAPLRVSDVEILGKSEEMLVSDPTQLSRVIDVTLTAGRLEDLHDQQIAVSKTTASDHGWHLGDTVDVTYPQTGVHTLHIAAIFESSDIIDAGYFVSTAVDDANATRPLDNQILVKLRSGADVAQARANIRQAASAYPTAKVQDITDVKRTYTSRINTFLAVIFGMLALSIVIAAIGISNTLQLSVYERTHELGLLRAVGSTRSQLRTMIRWEAAIIAVFGTIGGLLLGVAFGWAVVHGLGGSNNLLFRVPIGQAVVILVLGALVGVLAATRPASRAAKLDVIGAIASE